LIEDEIEKQTQFYKLIQKLKICRETLQGQARKPKKKEKKMKVNPAKLLGVKPHVLPKKITPAIQKQNHQESWFFSIVNHHTRYHKTKEVANLHRTCQHIFIFYFLLSK
jgi:hypothetical protein